MKKYFFILLAGIIICSCSENQKKHTSKVNTFLNAYFESIKSDTAKLKAFFKEMPKGGDIHHHAGGSPYAEEYIKIALRDSCFINPKTYQLYYDKNDAQSRDDSSAILINLLLEGNPSKKDSIIDNWSIRNYKQTGKDGRDLFFSTFAKFIPAFVGHESELLSEICRKAALENISYIETMIRVSNIQDSVSKCAEKDTWDFDNNPIAIKLTNLYKYYKENGIEKWAKINADSLNNYFDRTNKHGVKLRFQTYVGRATSNQTQVFGHLLLAFETAIRTENLVGVNLIAPEDNYNALKNYTTHMHMLGFLSKKYPSVHIALHAGELVLGKGEAKPEDLKYHIKQALDIANAKRIGHGVDLICEDDYDDILKFMKENNCAVEINLKSNEVLLETNKINHPVKIYFNYGVPICISTDDEGVLRTNLTNQYMLLIQYIPEITYTQIKQIVYNSIQYSFMTEIEKSTLKKRIKEKFDDFEQEITTYNK